MNDAYHRFLTHFRISVDELIQFGLSETVFPDATLVDRQWDECKRKLDRREDHWIRGYGRDALGTKLYERFYQILLGLRVIKDPNNNYHPKRMLERVTRNSTKSMTNYQVSHIFGRTKNPVLFTAPWNIVWKPKVLDPFTGHETTGQLRDAYIKSYHEHVRVRYQKYLEDYERLREIYFQPDSITDALETMRRERLFGSLESKKRFEASVRHELGTLQ